MNNTETERPLMPAEKVYWTLEQKGMIHFVIAAEIETPQLPAEKAWRQALKAMQQRHKALTYRIKGNDNGEAVFQEDPTATIPLNILPFPLNGSWTNEAEKELASPFNTANAPLVRLSILEKTTGCIALLTCNHSIGDGLAAAYLLRELVSYVASSTDFDDVTVHPAPAIDRTLLPERTQFKNAPPITVQCIDLGPGITTRLIARTKTEETTVHSAITAAVTTAVSKLSPEWLGDSLNVLHPVSYRNLLDKGDSFALLAGIQIRQYAFNSQQPFWVFARSIRKGMENVQSLEALQGEMQSLQQLFVSGMDTDMIYHALENLTRHDVLISNLGAVPAEWQYGKLVLKAIYGPMVLPDHEHVQSFGITTINGRLTITLTSRWPVQGLLDTVREILVSVI